MNCVVVPIYKEFSNLSEQEIISISQLYKILYKHPIYLIGPKYLNWNLYIKDAKLKGVNVIIKNFDNLYFKNIPGYNKLLTSSLLYKSFIKYEYFLLYQLDAYVFKDELDFWCNKEFDYIGAPWFEGWHLATVNSKMIGVGNGGFSLRNVRKSLLILDNIRIIKLIRFIWYGSIVFRIINFDKFIIPLYNHFQILNKSLLNKILFYNGLNEDVFWAQNVGTVFSNFKIASIEDASKFCFEVNPSLLYKENSNQLPFGCHAWEKNEPEFWNDWILTPDKNL